MKHYRGFFNETRDSFLLEKTGAKNDEMRRQVSASKRELAAEQIDDECKNNKGKYKPRKTRNAKQERCAPDQETNLIIKL